MRWTRQRHSNCVPVGILNAVKWLGYEATSRDVIDIKNSLMSLEDEYSTYSHFAVYRRLILALPGDVKEKTMPSPMEVDDHIAAGGIVILRSAWVDERSPDPEGMFRHLLIAARRTEKIWFLVNTYRGHAWFPKWAAVGLYMERHGVHHGSYPTAFFVSRSDDMECPTGKHCHKSKRKAETHLRRLKEIMPDGYGAGHVYRCDQCGCWHVGRQKKNAHKNKYKK